MRAGLYFLTIYLFLLALTACHSEVPQDFPENVDVEAYRRPSPDQIPYRLSEKLKPEEVQRLVALGRTLFFDPRLSRNGLMSCATCHNPGFHWTDSLKVSVENSSRRTMALFNLAWDKNFMWNGTLHTLVNQAMLPLTAPLGMNGDDAIIHERIASIPYYRDEILDLHEPVTGKREIEGLRSVIFPLEYFISSLMSPVAPFDRWVAGDDNAITPQQKRGFRLFAGKARCAECHAGWRFSDGNTYDIGMPTDPASGRIMMSPLLSAKAVGLRNIADRPPYFHNGTKATLEEVIEFYDRGGEVQRPGLSDKITRLDLTIEEKKDLRSFLDSLSGPMEEVPIPILPR